MRRETSDFSDGFDKAEIATDLFDDDRVRRLARTVDADRLERAMVVLVAVILASWRTGRRVTAEDACPLWLSVDRLAVATEDLRSVGLVEKSGRVRASSWSKRYEPVRERRERNRERWSRYNASRSGSTADVPRGSDRATRVVPQLSDPILSDPLRRARGRGRARGDESQATEKPKTVGEILREGPTFREAVAAAGYDPTKGES